MANFMSMLLLTSVLFTAPSWAAAQTSGSSDAIEETANGSINWTVGEVYARGIGAPPAFAANAAQARAMAERAAFVVALRNLLETVKGVRVDSDTVVENFMVKSDVIRTRVDGIVRGARIVKTQYMSDGAVEMLVAMPMKGAFLNALVPETFGKPLAVTPQGPPVTLQNPSDIKPSQPAPTKPAIVPTPEKKEPVKPEPSKQIPPAEPRVQPSRPEQPRPTPQVQADSSVSFNGGVATGLVIDGRGLGLRPALLPRIVDQQGQEVYVGQVVTRTNAVEQGVAGYAKDVNAAANNFRVTDNPAVIKGLSAAGATKTDIVIGQADAQALRQLSSKGDFLQYCRVIIVY